LPAEKTTSTPARAASSMAAGSDELPGSSGASSGPRDRLSTRAPRATASARRRRRRPAGPRRSSPPRRRRAPARAAGWPRSDAVGRRRHGAGDVGAVLAGVLRGRTGAAAAPEAVGAGSTRPSKSLWRPSTQLSRTATTTPDPSRPAGRASGSGLVGVPRRLRRCARGARQGGDQHAEQRARQRRAGCPGTVTVSGYVPVLTRGDACAGGRATGGGRLEGRRSAAVRAGAPSRQPPGGRRDGGRPPR
jgi:hypothetical protein